ncbi:hypothetical protein QFC21_007327 [Naganishia friedmannii]|uniref:Uncharacterized protein n=1 Tax=Naganishia friedmannii TaxID=89922 RepID=A0ACC2UVH8_9TREE|nr:hypothetical protein QFC21_007327 [Naganishia friedmannii]
MAYELPEGYTREMLNQVEQEERDLLPGITPLMDEPRESWRASDTVWIAIAEFVCQFDMRLPSSAIPPQAYDTTSHRCKPAPFARCIVYRVLRFGRAWSDSGYSDKPMGTVTEADEPYGCVPMKTFRMALGLHQIELNTAFSATLLLQQNQAAKRKRNLNLESETLKHTIEQLRLARVRDKRDCDESIQALRDESKQLKDGLQRERKTRDEAARTLASQHQQRIENAGLALGRLKMNVEWFTGRKGSIPVTWNNRRHVGHAYEDMMFGAVLEKGAGYNEEGMCKFRQKFPQKSCREVLAAVKECGKEAGKIKSRNGKRKAPPSA